MTTVRHLVAATGWVALMLLAGNCMAKTIRVPADQPTIQAGLDAASSGDAVVVAPGTYLERIHFHGKVVKLTSSQGPHVTIIDGQFGGSVISLQSGEGPGTVIEGFTITRGFSSFGAGVWILGSSGTFRGNVFAGNVQSAGGAGVAIGGFIGSPIVDGNEFTGNTCGDDFLSGVLSFVNGSSPHIVDNLIHDNDCRAINMTIPVGAAPVVFNNTIVRNQTGIYIDHRVSNADQTFRNNLIVHNGIGLEVAFAFDVAFDAVWTNNLLFGNGSDVTGVNDPTGTNGNRKADPSFLNEASGDYRLRAGSPALDAGTAIGLVLPATDFAGAPRVQDNDEDGVAVVDIGALEGAVAASAAPAQVPVDSPIALGLLALAILGLERRRARSDESRRSTETSA